MELYPTVIEKSRVVNSAVTDNRSNGARCPAHRAIKLNFIKAISHFQSIMTSSLAAHHGGDT